MATLKISVFILNWVGGGSFLYSLLISIVPKTWLAEINIGDIREPYKTFIIIMGMLWVSQKIYAGYQQGRAKKIENDEKEYEFRIRKMEHPIKH